MGPVSARRLAEAIKAHGLLARLELSHNFVGHEGARHLSEALTENRSMTRLGLSLNSIEDDGACYLAGALQCNACLTHLDLSYNLIRAVGARQLSRALMSNCAVTCLDMQGNLKIMHETEAMDEEEEELDGLLREIQRLVQQNKVPQMVLTLQLSRSVAEHKYMEAPSSLAHSGCDGLHFFLRSGPLAQHERQRGGCL